MSTARSEFATETPHQHSRPEREEPPAGAAGTAIAEHLAGWASRLRLGLVPEAAVEVARRSLVDVAGVTLAGSVTESARRLARLAAEVYATGPCVVVGSSRSLSAPGAALANGCAAHALDFDDNCYAGIVHGSATTFPAVLAAAQIEGASGERLLEGFIAGLEVEFALGAALGRSLYDRGWWSTSVLGAVGAAAGAGRVLALDRGRMSAALGLAVAGAGGIRAVRGTEGKHYLCGRAAEAGVLCALHARGGASGPHDAFEDRNGFLRAFNDGRIDVERVERIGVDYGLVTPGVDIKKYPIRYASHAAVDAVAGIMAEQSLHAGDVERVLCRVPPLVASNLTYDRPVVSSEAQFSLPFAVASMIVFGDIGLEHLEAPLLHEPGLRSMMERVEMVVDEDFHACFDPASRCPEGAAVALDTRDGRAFESFGCEAKGAAGRALGRDALLAKFMACAGRAVDGDVAERWLHDIAAVEAAEDSSTLFRLA